METGTCASTENAVNLSHFRLDDRSDWVDRYYDSLGQRGFQDYRMKVYNALSKLRKGHFYNVLDIEEEKQELFIKFCCEYILHYDGDIYFDEDFTKVWRNKL